MKTPYSSINRDKNLLDKRKILTSSDSTSFVIQLQNLILQEVNRYNGGFSNADCFLKSEGNNQSGLSQNCLDGITQISIVAKLRLTNFYLVNVELHEGSLVKYSLLLTVDKTGILKDGLVGGFSTGWYNKHGTVTRQFTVTKNNTIQISEASLGDNTTEYRMTATYRLSKEGNLDLKNISLTYK
ncbi:hypothetical protein [Microcoleus sp. F10-A1]|uniref:hypothetical protein n=1 Tax=Microcoleus sp. F10-A1 TaxID=2818750 RepID=UPI002FD61112